MGSFDLPKGILNIPLGNDLFTYNYHSCISEFNYLTYRASKLSYNYSPVTKKPATNFTKDHELIKPSLLLQNIITGFPDVFKNYLP